MTYILWGILNIGLFLLFISYCIKMTKFIREKLGIFASIIFVFGLLSFINPSKNNSREPNSNQNKTWKFTNEDSLYKNNTYILNIDLEDNLVSKYYMGLIYGKEKHGEKRFPISAYSSKTGFIIGTNWKPNVIIINKTSNNNKFEYFVQGVVEWKLLWATIYCQQKKYKGIALTK